MNDNLFKHISEYFNSFPKEDYTIYVNGVSTKRCSLNSNNHCVVWNIPSDNNECEWYFINDYEIEAISLTPMTMEIIKTNGKEYTFAAKIKRKEEKAKDIIFRTKNALYTRHINDALDYLDKLEALMNE